MRIRWSCSILLSLLVVSTTICAAEDNLSFEHCILDLLESQPGLTGAEMKAACGSTTVDQTSKKNESSISDRLADDSETMRGRNALTPHKPNYLLPISYNANQNTAVLDDELNLDLDDNEIQFQVSIKFPLWSDIADQNISLLTAYTARSFWQAYNGGISAPFRDTNYEPDIWLEWRPDDADWGPISPRWLRFGAVHQSNGRAGVISRSWNRIYADFGFDFDRVFVSFRPWYRIPENASDDDNPDIDDYLGSFELLTAYKTDGHTFSAMLRNNLRTENKGAIDLSWSFPVGQKVKGYVKYFNGYGETLLNYDHRSERYSLGFVIGDWL